MWPHMSLFLRTRFHEQSLFAKYLHAFVSDFQNKCHLKCFNCLSILRNRYNPMKIDTVVCKACNFGKDFGGIFGHEKAPLFFAFVYFQIAGNLCKRG